MTGRNEAGLKQTLEECSRYKAACYPVTGDLTNESDVVNIVDTTLNQLGKLDILVSIHSN